MDERDDVLVQRAVSGDSAAFEELVRRYYRATFAIAIAHLRDHHDAEDLCQDVFVKCWERIADCTDPARFRFWLWSVTRNHALNRIAHRARRDHESLDAATNAVSPDSPIIDLHTARTRALLLRAMDRLSVIERQVLLLFDLEGYSHRDIAAAANVSEGMSRRHLLNARRRMREQLNERGGVE